MIRLTVNDKVFLVDFRHRRRTGRRPQLYYGSPLNGVTTCVIVGIYPNLDFIDPKASPTPIFVALGTGICVRSDGFQRRLGLRESFQDAVVNCKLFDATTAAGLLALCDAKWPAQTPAMPRPIKPKVVLSDDVVAELRRLAALKTPDGQQQRDKLLKTSIAAFTSAAG